jgi:hypothetical protein
MRRIQCLRNDATTDEEAREKFSACLPSLWEDEDTNMDEIARVLAWNAKKATIFTTERHSAVDCSSSLKKIPGAAARFVNHVCTLLCIELLTNAFSNVEKSLPGEFMVEHDGASMFVVPRADTMHLEALMAETERLRVPAMEPQSRRIQNF